MITFPNAKINLGLNITRKRPDGYHDLETVFYPVPVEDILEVKKSDGSQTEPCVLHTSGLQVDGPDENNLAVKAYRLLASEFDLPPVEVCLHKHIPFGAGLGGGSADAAFMLKMLNQLFSLNLTRAQLEEYAARLGADCAFFIENKPVFAEGIGNLFSPIELSLKGYQLYLIKPDIFVSTRDAFAKIAPASPSVPLTEIIKRPVAEWKDVMVNDFERSVFPQFPAIGDLKESLYEHGALYASMSGSGSSVFGIFAPGVQLPEIPVDDGSFVFKAELR